MLDPLMLESVPHWEKRFPKEVAPAFEHFTNFLAIVWDHLGLPVPTPAQYQIAHRLQWGVDSVEYATMSDDQKAALAKKPRKDIIRCFRAIGKSYITAAFAVWLLMRNPRDEKVLVTSATGSKSKEFVDQTKGILESLPLVSWLLLGEREGGARRRDMADKFDVAGGSNSQSFSVKAVGITGQIAGSRATTLIGDDIEIDTNSFTEDGRQRILNAIRSNFEPIINTEVVGDQIMLGTPQTEESVYNVLVAEMDFTCFTIPLEFPSVEKRQNYSIKIEETGEVIDIFAPFLQAEMDAGNGEPGTATDTRFGFEDIISKKAQQGRAKYALQYMLDTSLSDSERYPLRQHDLLVFNINTLKAPLTVQWGKDSSGANVVTDMRNAGFAGDYFLRPLFVDVEWREYEGSVLYVDPAGRGADETAWAIVKQLGGVLYCPFVGGYKGEPSEAMRLIALDAKKYDVNLVEIEPNYGQGMWIAAFQPVLAKVWKGGTTVVESEWSKGQKETRIIDTLEPVIASHRLVMDETLIRDDVERGRQEGEKDYSLMHQMTHITRDRGALKHEDRLEALSGAVGHFMRAMEMDAKDAKMAYMNEELDELIESYEHGAQHLARGAIMGRRRANGSISEVFRLRI